MKKSSLPRKSLKAKQPAHTRLREAGQPPHSRSGRDWGDFRKRAIVFLCVALTAGIAYTISYFFLLSRIPRPMIGAWAVMEVTSKGAGKADESLKGGTLDFRRDGTMIGKINMAGKEGTIQATVAVEGDMLRITSVNPQTGQAVTDVQTIRILASDQFVIEDRKGTTLRMERVRD
jgi:hypothetical protein